MFGLLTLGKSEEASFNIVYNNIKFNKYKGSSNNKLIMKQKAMWADTSYSCVNIYIYIYMYIL